MTRTQLIAGLERLAGERDTETAHKEADDLIMAWLRQAGMGEIAEAWSKVRRWYE